MPPVERLAESEVATTRFRSAVHDRGMLRGRPAPYGAAGTTNLGVLAEGAFGALGLVAGAFDG
jgi:hypothetical protein